MNNKRNCKVIQTFEWVATHRTTESNTLIGYITLVTLYNQYRQMGSQNSFYYFVIWLIKCNDFDSYEKTDIHFVSYKNKTLQKPRYQLKIWRRKQFLVHFAWLVLRLTLSIGKTLVFSRICRFSFALNIFVNIWCALVSRYSYLKKNSYHIWMNHCEHKIHHLTTTFRRNISNFVAYMWCSHRRFKNAVSPVFNASIQFNFSWFLIK